MPRRSRPIHQQHSQMRFNPPRQSSTSAYGTNGLGYGGSSGPGCGGGDFWAELAQFGIYPTTSSNISSGSNNARTIFNSSNLGKFDEIVIVF